MKASGKILTTTMAILLISGIILPIKINAQAPEKMSYQAVIRDSDNELVADKTVGIQISIIQGSIYGASVYVETQTPETNANGLVSLEIGTGNILNGNISTIDWSAGPYYIKTETDPDGGTNYSISGTSQILSVPYAMYAKKAETVTGGVSETDPVFSSSSASSITSTDMTNWNTAYGWGDHASAGCLAFVPDISSASYQMQAIHPNLLFKGRLHSSSGETINGVLTVGFSFYDTESGGSPLWSETQDITFDQGYFTAQLGSEVSIPDDVFVSLPFLEITIGGETLTDRIQLHKVSHAHYSNFAGGLAGSDGMGQGSGLDADLLDGLDSDYFMPASYTETDPVFESSPASEITASDTTKWSSKQDSVKAGNGIEIKNNVISETPYQVGDFAHGGVVFWVDDSGEHGLLCAKGDQVGEDSIQWYNGSYVNTSAWGDGLYAGEMNTALIVAAQEGGPYDYAAAMCASFGFIVDGVKYGDWYLPSVDELKLMYQNKNAIDSTSAANGGASFTNSEYWSSEEYDLNNAYIVNFNGGNTDYKSKNRKYKIRAVRKF